ncbi:MAG: choice-of-anchor D domain-containing protein [Calditrichota bacterium]
MILITNDPNNQELVISLRGHCVPAIPPTVSLSDWGIDFGDVPLDESRDYQLTIQNLGDLELEIENITAGDEAFTTSFVEPVRLPAEGIYELTITFAPELAQFYETRLIIESNDPERGRIEVWMGGRGLGPRVSAQPDFIDFGETVLGNLQERSFSLSNQGLIPLVIQPDEIESEFISTNIRDFIPTARHFQFLETYADHSILVRSAQIDGRPLDRQDEIAVITPRGECAGAFIVQNSGEMLGFAAWQSDDLAEITGFEDGQSFTFVFWDASTHQVIAAVADFIEGPDVFTGDGFSVVDLTSTDEREEFPWPPLILPPGWAIQVNCAFRPNELGECNYQWILRTNDQNNPNYMISFQGWGIPSLEAEPTEVDFGEVMMCGIGRQAIRILNHNPHPVTVLGVDIEDESFWAFPAPEIYRPYFQFSPQAEDHSLLIREALLDGGYLAPGDEIAVFTTDGFCAGATVIENCGTPTGLAAWEDNYLTEAVDGFQNEESFVFRFWQSSTSRVIDAEASFVAGPSVFGVNQFSVLDLVSSESRRPGAFRPVVIPPESGIDLNVFFSPPQTEFYQASLTIHTNFQPQSEIEIPLSGRGTTAPDIELSDDRHDFGSVQLGEEIEWTLSVTNQGEATLEVDSLLLIDMGFSLVRNVGFRLDFDQTQRIRIRFSPTESRLYQGRLFILSNDPDEASKIVTLCGQGVRNLTVTLNGGWNMISLNIVPPRDLWARNEGPDIIRMTERLRIDQNHHHVLLMKDEDGRFYAPAFNFCGIPYWSLLEGYQIKLDTATQVSWTGESIPADSPIPLEAGWNLIPYYPQYELDASAPDFLVLSPIIDHVIIAKDERGNFINTAFGFSNMPPWREGKGYQVRVDQQVVFSYPPEQGFVQQNAPELTPKFWTSVDPTACNMSVLIASVSGVKLQDGVQIAAIDQNGRVVGVGIAQEGRCGLAVWGDDASTETTEGLCSGEAFTLRLMNGQNSAISDLEVKTIHNGRGLVFGADEFSALDMTVKAAIPEAFYLSPNYPNPFNNITRIDYGVPEAAHITVTVFDVAGRAVATLIDGDAAAGNHVGAWDAAGASAGVYLVQMRADGFESIQKMMLVK